MCPIANITGPSGATWLIGVGVPSSGLGTNGDLYLDSSNSYFYFKTSGAWEFQGQLTSNSDGALDGGFANSTYLVSQVVDGGGA